MGRHPECAGHGGRDMVRHPHVSAHSMRSQWGLAKHGWCEEVRVLLHIPVPDRLRGHAPRGRTRAFLQAVRHGRVDVMHALLFAPSHQHQLARLSEPVPRW
jgi:hypothetical protein